MTEQELERALREALPPLEPEPNFIEQVLARIDPMRAQPLQARRAVVTASGNAVLGRASARRHWLPAAIAAGVLIAFGFTQWAQVQRQRQLQLQLRAQLMQGLTIASATLQDARSVVLHSEQSTP